MLLLDTKTKMAIRWPNNGVKSVRATEKYIELSGKCWITTYACGDRRMLIRRKPTTTVGVNMMQVKMNCIDLQRHICWTFLQHQTSGHFDIDNYFRDYTLFFIRTSKFLFRLNVLIFFIIYASDVLILFLFLPLLKGPLPKCTRHHIFSSWNNI